LFISWHEMKQVKKKTTKKRKKESTATGVCSLFTSYWPSIF
jgi:hypothetical protein